MGVVAGRGSQFGSSGWACSPTTTAPSTCTMNLPGLAAGATSTLQITFAIDQSRKRGRVNHAGRLHGRKATLDFAQNREVSPDRGHVAQPGRLRARAMHLRDDMPSGGIRALDQVSAKKTARACHEQSRCVQHGFEA